MASHTTPAANPIAGLAGALHPDAAEKTFALAKVSDVGGDLAIHLFVALVILLATFWLAGWAAKLARAGLGRWPRTHADLTLQEFTASVVRYAVIVIGLIAVLRHLGVETTSIIAVLGAASLAVGLALQGALSNVAAGVMLLILRPYQVGDYVTIAGKSGTVKRLDLFNTEMRDGDNLKILVPNGKAFGDVVINFTELENRRIELVFGIGYDDDVDKALALAKACAADDDRIFKTPAPWAAMTELASSTVNVTLRCWTGVNGYWDVRYALLKRVKDAFEREGVSLPFPTTVSIPGGAVGQGDADRGDPAPSGPASSNASTH